MRKLLFIFVLLIAGCLAVNAQSPGFFNYQGVVRNSVGNALVNKTIRLRLTIHDGSATGIPVYRETRMLTTNAFGLFNVQVGGGGATDVLGSVSAVDWKSGAKWMQVEVDTEGGTTFKDIGATQLSSVPYALFTNLTADIILPFNKTQNEELPLIKITNTGNNASSLAFEGLSNSTANNATAIRGILLSTSPGVSSAAVVGQNNGTGANGIGVYGNQNGTGWGVYGSTPGGVGVYGNSTTGMGVYGQSVSGPSVMGYQPNTGTSNAGYFQNFSTTNTAAALRVLTNGLGEGVGVNMTGLGKGGIFTINNATNGNNVIEASTNGLGKVALLQNTNAANSSNILDVSTNGIGRAGYFQNTNTANTAPNISSLSNGSGDGIQSLMTGTGKAGLFNINNAANTNFAIDASSNGTNNVINSVNTGTGRAGFFQVNNAASSADALSAVTNGAGVSWAIRGLSTGTNGAGLFIQSNVANTANNLQSNQAGLGRAALFNATNTANASNALEVNQSGTGRVVFFDATNAANASNALEVNMAGAGFAASFTNTNAIPKALRTAGALQFTGINEGPGRIMATLDGTGTATWQNAASAGLVSGSGTLNYVPKWTPDGTIIGNSQIFDNGTNIGIGTFLNNTKLNISSPSSLEYPFYASVDGTGNIFRMNKDGQLYISSTKPGSFNYTENFAVMVDGEDQGMVIRLNGKPYPDGENHYISFVGADNIIHGRIEGQTWDEKQVNNFEYMFEAANLALELSFQALELGAELLELHFLSAAITAAELASTAIRIAVWVGGNQSRSGVAYESGSADYAEWLEKNNATDKFTFGDIVGVNGGKISKKTIGAEKLMVISMAPIVLGNLPEKGNEHNFEKVAFMGQVPVKVSGEVHPGDYILASELNDGFGVALNPGKMMLADYKRIVGVAWSVTSFSSNISMVNTAVGINNNDLVGQLMQQQGEISQLKNSINNLTAYLQAKDTNFKAELFLVKESSDNNPPGISEPGKNTDKQQQLILPAASLDQRIKALQSGNLKDMVYNHPEALRKDFEKVKEILDKNGVDYNRNPEIKKMVTDFDYFVLQMKKLFEMKFEEKTTGNKK